MANFRRESYAEVAIIVPTKVMDDYAIRCQDICEFLYPDAEVMVITDEDCPGYPSDKRNYAMEKTNKRVLAFLDSDAFPGMDWLDRALDFLEEYPAVCGPGILPPDAPIQEYLADIVYRLLPYNYRVAQRKPRIVAEYPTFNLVVKRSMATKFENYLTGEDSLFCRKIKEGIFYHPDILVYHNRRPVFKRLWKQIGTYGLHRGYLIRRAFVGWVTSCIAYAFNFVKGLFVRRPS